MSTRYFTASDISTTAAVATETITTTTGITTPHWSTHGYHSIGYTPPVAYAISPGTGTLTLGIDYNCLINAVNQLSKEELKELILAVSKKIGYTKEDVYEFFKKEYMLSLSE